MRAIVPAQLDTALPRKTRHWPTARILLIHGQGPGVREQTYGITAVTEGTIFFSEDDTNSWSSAVRARGDRAPF